MAKRNATVTVDGRTVTVNRNPTASTPDGCYDVEGLAGDFAWDCAVGEVVGSPRSLMSEQDWERLNRALCAELDAVRNGR